VAGETRSRFFLFRAPFAVDPDSSSLLDHFPNSSAKVVLLRCCQNRWMRSSMQDLLDWIVLKPWKPFRFALGTSTLEHNQGHNKSDQLPPPVIGDRTPDMIPEKLQSPRSGIGGSHREASPIVT
jgi:hypothetical protein